MLVTRQAVCAADDQLDDLEMLVELSCGMTLADCLASVAHAEFLQFSSTHACATGYLNERAVVLLSAGAPPVYLADPALPVAAMGGEPRLSFRFA